MWTESFGKKIARILNLMDDKPNRTPHPAGGGGGLFDGGQWTVMSGLTSYEFSDGSTAFYGTGPNWGLTIKLPTGEEVHIDVPRRNCQRCDNLIWLGDRYCKQCGQDCASQAIRPDAPVAQTEDLTDLEK